MKTDFTNPLFTQKRTAIVTRWAILICIGLSAIGYLLLQRPNYLVLPIQYPLSYLPRGDWLSTSYSTFEFPGSQDRYYVWRRETYVWTHESDPRSPFDTSQAIWKYFDNWLTGNGWVAYESSYEDPCPLYMPESNFLDSGFDGYVLYEKPDANSYSTSPTICLAIWSFKESYDMGRYHIVLVTINPSILTAWNNQFELGWK